MKKALLASLVCAGVAVARSSYGNGYIIFDNYFSNPYMPIEYLGTHVGVADSNYHVDLLYSFGSSVTPTNDLGLSVAINPGIKDLFGNAGYFQGGVTSIPGYVSGPVSFDIVCWLTVSEGEFTGYATYGEAVNGYGSYGQSAVFTESSLATGINPPNYFAD